MPQPTDAYVNRVLTDISVKYTNKKFVSDDIFPIVTVDRETGLYFVFDKSNLRAENSLRRGMAHSNEVDYGTTTATYGPLIEHSLKIGLPQAVLDQYDTPLQPRTNATNTVTEKIYIEKEKAIAAILSNTAVVTQNTTLSGSSQWSDPASTPITDIQAGIDAMVLNGLVAPNTAVMGWPVWSKLKNHSTFVNRILYGGGSGMKDITLDMVAAFFGLDRVIVSQAVENTANEGATAATGFIWGKHFQLLYVDPSQNLETITAGRTLTMKGARTIFNWPDSEPGVGEWVKFMDKYEHKVVAGEAIYAILNAVA